ncbi:MAG: transposase [Bacteroidota bacterium]
MRRTFQYRAILSETTEANCVLWLEQCRTLYNLALEQRIMVYRQSKKSLSLYTQQKQLPELKESFPDFACVGSQCLQDVLDRLDKAFKAFFQRCKQGKAGFPRFKGKDRYDSFTLKQSGWKLEGRYLHLAKIGRLRLYLSRPIEGDIKTVTVHRSPTGKWFVSFSCDNVPPRVFPVTDRAVGIDVGIKSFAVDSDGETVKNPKHLRQSLKELRIKQRTLARRVRGSRRRHIASMEVATLHERVANQRKDFLNKTANRYIQQYQYIVVEDLNINGMVRNHCLALSIQDSSWGMFFNLLSHKAEEAGRVLVKVNPRGTSQRCSACGENVPKKLSQRIHACPSCGLVIDRDENAALNILAVGQTAQALSPTLGFA